MDTQTEKEAKKKSALNLLDDNNLEEVDNNKKKDNKSIKDNNFEF